MKERRRAGRDDHKFQQCFRCKKFNTTQMAVSDTDDWMCYIGWCHDCQDDYGYQIRIETVNDRKGRL